MPRGEGSFKAGPAGSLCLIAPPECFQDIDPGIFPFKIRPAALPMLGLLKGQPRFLGKRELNCTFPGAVASTRLGCATGMASGEDERGVV